MKKGQKERILTNSEQFNVLLGPLFFVLFFVSFYFFCIIFFVVLITMFSCGRRRNRDNRVRIFEIQRPLSLVKWIRTIFH